MTVTNKNRKRELDRTRRQTAEKALDSRRKRSKKSHLIIADSDDDEEGDAAIEDKDSGEGTRLHENDTSNSHDSHLRSADVVSTL